jgi:hypothetical protein
VRRRGRAVSCCTARVFSNSSSQCGDNKRETLHPDSRLQPPPLFFSKTSELVSTVKCFFALSLVRVSLLPFRHRCEEIRTEKKQHTGRRIWWLTVRANDEHESRRSCRTFRGAQGVDRGREKSVNELGCCCSARFNPT